MENLKPINFLPNPHIKGKTLDYVKPVGVYANLFEMKFTKETKMYQYHMKSFLKFQKTI